MNDKRKIERTVCSRQVSISINSLEFEGTIENISKEGTLILTPQPLQLDQHSEIVITISLDKSVAVFPIRNYRKFLQELDSELANGSNLKRRQFKKIFTGCAIMDTLDKQNRIRLNTFLTNYAELDREVYVIGFNDYMEIWDRKKWDEFIDREIPKLADTLEQSSKPSTT